MQLELGGHPIHTRALSVVVARQGEEHVLARADLLDLRKRGFTPVGTALQGAGIIHQMGVEAVLRGAQLAVDRIAAHQPVVAYEASVATRGESCRDVTPALASLVGARIGEDAGERLREAMGGAAGCSHLLAAAQLLIATLRQLAAESPAALWAASACGAPHEVLRRDLIFDGCELAEGAMAVGVQLTDLVCAPAAPEARPIERLLRHDELRLRVELRGWPATIAALNGAARRRTRADFGAAAWVAHDALLAPLVGLELARGSNREISRRLAAWPALRDALLQLAPALIQCRASFPDKWLTLAATAAGHPGLIGMPDSCYMWRRGGALERVRESWLPPAAAGEKR